MLKYLLIVYFMVFNVLAEQGYSVNFIKIMDDNCHYVQTDCLKLLDDEKNIDNNVIATGTMTIKWDPFSSIGQDYYIANQIALKEGGKNGAMLLLFISSTEFKQTKNIASITYRMYRTRCNAQSVVNINKESDDPIVDTNYSSGDSGCIETQTKSEAIFVNDRDWNAEIIFHIKSGVNICVGDFGENNFWASIINGKRGFIHNAYLIETDNTLKIFNDYWKNK